MSLPNQQSKSKRIHLTEKEIRQVKGFENITQDQFNELRDSLYKLSIISYKIFSDE